MDHKYFVNELLYFVQNGINTQAGEDLIQQCVQFYSETEIENAKTYLWNKCDSFISDSMIRRKGVDKLIKNATDMVDMVYKMNWTKCPVRFAAIDATRVPSMVCQQNNDDVENKGNGLTMANIVRELHEMKKQIEFLTSAVKLRVADNSVMEAISNSDRRDCLVTQNPGFYQARPVPWTVVVRKKK